MRTALYRRYRPDTFQEVIGQEHVTVPLMSALDGDRTNHAYLFSGPRGCGKTTSARILARCLNCAKGPTSTPCGECESCVELARGGSGSLDVVEMDAASHGGVDDARELRERASFAPARDRFKIFIIDEAHMVSNQGFNALLKLVEEPPEHVKFIFATTEPEKVIGTIRSRTHHYPFRLVPPDTLEQYLSELCSAEGITPEPGVLPLVVRAGTGSVRDTLSVLDQLMGGAQGETLEYATSVALLGYTDGALLDEAVDAMAASDGAALYGAVDHLVQSGHDPRRFAEDLLARLRDIVVLSLAGDAARDVLSSVPADQLERMKSQAELLGAARSSKAADLVNAALGQMAGATSPRLQLELLCARLLVETADRDARPSSPVADPRAAARNFRKRKQEDSPAEQPVAPVAIPAAQSQSAPPPAPQPAPQRPEPAPAPQPSADVPVEQPAAEPAEPSDTPAPAPDEVAKPSPVDPVAELRSKWREVMKVVEESNIRTRQFIEEAARARKVDVSAAGVVLGFGNPSHVAEFHRDGHAAVFEKAITHVTGLTMDVTTDPAAPREPSDDQEGDLPVGLEEYESEYDSNPGPVEEDPVEEPGGEQPAMSSFIATDMPAPPPAVMPDFSALPVPPRHMSFEKPEPKFKRDLGDLGSRHISEPVEEEEELDVEHEEDLVSADDPMAVDVDGIGLQVVIDQFEGKVIEEVEDAR